MSALNQLELQPLWRFFQEICSIPHPSKYEKKLADHIKEFAKQRGLEILEDKVGNLVIRKPATPGMEKRPGLILQAHLDMVPQKNSDTVHDFQTDPIKAYVENGWVTADKTTLGADNGIGVAAALAVLDDTDLVHGPLEVLLTLDEETGMTGAFGLIPGVLKGEFLINLDTEDEGEIFVGCAGGVDVNITMDYETTPVSENVTAFQLSLTGLKGGHSGMDIALGRGNANKLVNRFLKQIADDWDFQIAEFHGGSLRNAIPREAFVTVTVPTDQAESFKKGVKAFEKIIQIELKAVEPHLCFQVSETDLPESVFTEESQNRLLRALYGCVNGVVRMNDEVPGVVETSTNLASVHSENGTISVQCLVRSSLESAKFDVVAMIQSTFELAGASVTTSGSYPGWQPKMDSSLLCQSRSVYKKMFGKEAKIKVIHAGLECGLLGSIYPEWEMIAIGPTIRDPHSPDEKVEIQSVGLFWQFLAALLKELE